MYMRLGDILVQRGVLSAEQSEMILDEQRRCNRPFGLLAERLFGVRESVVEEAWAEQYSAMADTIDPSTLRVGNELLSLVERRQAWQFGVLPVNWSRGELVACTTKNHLARAMRFVGWRVGVPCSFVLANPIALGQALNKFYPIDGLDPTMIGERRLAFAAG